MEDDMTQRLLENFDLFYNSPVVQASCTQQQTKIDSSLPNFARNQAYASVSPSNRALPRQTSFPSQSSMQGYSQGSQNSRDNDGSSTSGTGSYSEDSTLEEGHMVGLMDLGRDEAVGGDKMGQRQNGRRKRRSKDPPPATHLHLGGVRHCRVPLGPEIREVLECAWTSRIIQPGVDGRKEKERIAEVTGLGYQKVHEWFRNRKKKEKLLCKRKKGLIPEPSLKRGMGLKRQQSGSSSSSDLSMRLEAANLEGHGHPGTAGNAVHNHPLRETEMYSID